MKQFWLTDYEPEVQIELFKVSQKSSLRSALSSIALMIVILILVWPHASGQVMLSYTGLCLLSIAMRLMNWWQFQATADESNILIAGSEPRPDADIPTHRSQRIAKVISLSKAQRWNHQTAKNWQWRSAIGMALQGIATGAVGLFFGDHGMVNMLLICSYCATLSYSLVANSTHDLPAFFTGQGFGGAVMSIFLPNAFSDSAIYLLPLNLFFLVLISSAGVGAHRTFVNLIRLKIANAKLAQSNEKAALAADRANQDKSDFLAAASHDLRQPVHALMMFVESLKQYRRDKALHLSLSLQQDSTEDHLVSQIANASRAIGSMFNDLMELSKLESGVHIPQNSELLLGPLILQCVESVRHEAAAKGIHFKVRFSASVKSAAIISDRLMLARAITNLLSNAIRYTEKGKVLVTLRTRPKQALEKEVLELSVYDTGVGIAADHLERIFEPYVQLDNESRDRQKGLGMGLAIVARCLGLLKLPVRVTSHLSKGSRFWIELPNSMKLTIIEPKELEPNEALLAGLKNRRILLIDDDEMVRDGLFSLMQVWQVNFKAAAMWTTELREVLKTQAWQPDLVLCDFRLPGGVDGITLLGQILAEFPTAIGILQTGERTDLVQGIAEEAGYVVLNKPVSPYLLASTLSALLGSKSLIATTP
jgi:signal transduction histidine kinase